MTGISCALQVDEKVATVAPAVAERSAARHARTPPTHCHIGSANQNGTHATVPKTAPVCALALVISCVACSDPFVVFVQADDSDDDVPLVREMPCIGNLVTYA